jgi:hypothetical protein
MKPEEDYRVSDSEERVAKRIFDANNPPLSMSDLDIDRQNQLSALNEIIEKIQTVAAWGDAENDDCWSAVMQVESILIRYGLIGKRYEDEQ